jgi:hypothetical protein
VAYKKYRYLRWDCSGSESLDLGPEIPTSPLVNLDSTVVVSMLSTSPRMVVNDPI